MFDDRGTVDEARWRNMDKLHYELGEVVCDALRDNTVVEIMVNPDGRIWVDRLETGMEYTGHDLSPDKLLGAIGTIASMLRMEVNRLSPILEGELPENGARIEATIPPVTKCPGLTIRKHASVVFPLSRYLADGRISEKHHHYIEEAVRTRKNILVVGGTGSGKTTFVNALLHALCEIAPTDRVVVIEDTPELQCDMENSYPMCTDVKSGTDMQALVRVSLRERPDRIIVGEVRSGVALDLLKSWNTGHPGGISTVHANSAASALTRLEQLIGEVSKTPMKSLVGEAVDVVVFLRREARIGPVVTEVMEVKGVDEKEAYICEFL